MLGDSIAFGYWVSDAQGFARQFETLLGDGSPAGDRVEVLNFGVPGYNLEQEIEALRANALAFAPDVVVVLFCLNDLEGLFSYEFGLVQERTERRRTLVGQVARVARRALAALLLVEYRLTELDARRHFVKAKNPLEGRLYRDAVSQQQKALQGEFAVLRAVLASRGIPGLVVVVPILGDRFERYPHRELHRRRRGLRPNPSRSAPSTSSTASRPTSSATCVSTSCTRALSATGSRPTRCATRCARAAGCARASRPAPAAATTGRRTSRRCADSSGVSAPPTRRNVAF